MKRALLIVGGAFAALLVILVVNALRAEAPVQDAVEPADLAEIDADRVARHLGEALRFETISARGEPHASAEAFHALHDWLAATYPLTHAALERDVVNGESLLFKWEGTDPSLLPVAFLAHMDVVPVDDSTLDAWTHPPFGGVVDDGYVWGRGALDMKGIMIALIESVEWMLARDMKPARTIYLAFGHDEEVGGGAGAHEIARLLESRGERLAFVLDEGGMVSVGTLPGLDAPIAMIAVAEKGYLTLDISASADGGHSSTPPDETAVGALAEAIVALQASPFPASVNDTMGTMIERIGARSPFAVRLVTANRWLFDPIIARAAAGRDPIMASMLRTTTAPTMLEASPKENVLAQTATAKVNFRVIPGETAESVTERVRALVEDDRIEVRAGEIGRDPSSVSSTDNASWQSIERSARTIFPDAIVVPGLLMGGTDSRQYQDVTEDTYRFAAVIVDRDDISRFHGLDERIAVASLGPMVQFYVHLMGTGLAPDEAAGSAAQ